MSHSNFGLNYINRKIIGKEHLLKTFYYIVSQTLYRELPIDVLDDFSLLLFTLKSQGRSQGRHIIEMEHISMVNDKLKAFKYYVYRRTDEFLELFHLPYLLSLAQLL